MYDADERVTRGAGVGDPFSTTNPVDPMLEFLSQEWTRIGDRNYPPWFLPSDSGPHRAHPRDIDRMRRVLGRMPRVDARQYDIVFNTMLRTWTIVKWVSMPQPVGFVPGIGYVTEAVREPVEVYEIDARHRSPETLGEWDWEILRQRCTTALGRRAVDGQIRESNEALQRDRERERADRETDFLEYYHDAIREQAEALGIDNATPEELAAKLGGHPIDYQDFLTD